MAETTAKKDFLVVRLSKADKLRLKLQAELSGTSLSEYVRERVIELIKR